jgi:hypothetical protein
VRTECFLLVTILSRNSFSLEVGLILLYEIYIFFALSGLGLILGQQCSTDLFSIKVAFVRDLIIEKFFSVNPLTFGDTWVRVTMAWRVLRLRTKERLLDMETICEYIE